jgi:chromosome segregation ATPase
MWIKKLTLINWQAHENLTLDFTSGVNFIHGRSGTGKSCIRRAISWVFGLDSYPEDDLRKEGTKKTSVIVVLDNDVEVERVKSASINRYITRVPGQKELEYDAIGKGAPEEVQKLLQLYLIEIDDKTKLNLNISEQIDMPFLDDSSISGTAKLKLFNKLCGQDLLDLVVGNFNKEILSINKEIKNAKEVIEINEPTVKTLGEDIQAKRKICTEVEETLKLLKEDYQAYLKLTELREKLNNNRAQFFRKKLDLEQIKLCEEKAIASLKGEITSFIALETLNKALISVKSRINSTEAAIAQLKVPEVNIEGLRAQIKRLEELTSLNKGLNEVKAKLCIKKEALEALNKEIPMQEQTYKTILQEAGICPICKQDTKNCEVHL